MEGRGGGGQGAPRDGRALAIDKVRPELSPDLLHWLVRSLRLSGTILVLQKRSQRCPAAHSKAMFPLSEQTHLRVFQRHE